jgi:DUF971 family protein
MQSLPPNVVPTSYELDEDRRQLHLSWSDGHESVYDYERLRRACPCAWCAGEGSFAGTMQSGTSLTEQQTTLYEIVVVGRYGLTPVWGDGHRTGIYTFERLRDLCECDACQAARGNATQA